MNIFMILLVFIAGYVAGVCFKASRKNREIERLTKLLKGPTDSLEDAVKKQTEQKEKT